MNARPSCPVFMHRLFTKNFSVSRFTPLTRFRPCGPIYRAEGRDRHKMLAALPREGESLRSRTSFRIRGWCGAMAVGEAAKKELLGRASQAPKAVERPELKLVRKVEVDRARDALLTDFGKTTLEDRYLLP